MAAGAAAGAAAAALYFNITYEFGPDESDEIIEAMMDDPDGFLDSVADEVLEREYGATALDTVGRELDTLEDLDQRLGALSTEIEAKTGVKPE